MKYLIFTVILMTMSSVGHSRNKKSSFKKKKQKFSALSKVALEFGVMAPDGIPFSLKLNVYKSHWLRLYAAPPITFQKDSTLDERQVIDLTNVVSIKNTEGVLPTDVTFGPHFGFDYIVPIKRKWSVFGGLAYRKVSVEGSSKSPIQVEILGNQTPSFVEADIYTSAQYEQYGLRAGANYELYRYSRNFKVNFSMGFGFLLRLKKHITLVFRLVIIFLVSIFRGSQLLVLKSKEPLSKEELRKK